MSKNRRRFVFNQWVRDPNGPFLKKPPPVGKRPPNQIIWGHSVDDFFWIQRIPGINVVTIWSRSMIQDFGENFIEAEHGHEPNPRQLRPWPILQLPSGVHSDPPLGFVDETCFCNHLRSPLVVSLYDDDGNLRISDAKELSGNSQITEAREVGDDDKTLFCHREGLNGSSIDTSRDDFTIKDTVLRDFACQKDQTVQVVLPTAGASSTNPGDVAIETQANLDKCKDLPAKDPHVAFQPTLQSGIETSLKVEIPFSALPKLEEFIPIEYFPDILLVNDPDNATDATQRRHGRGEPVNLSPIKYKRVLPKLERDAPVLSSDSPHPVLRTAYLNLASAPLLGSGHHSHVYSASLRLPEPLTARSPNGEVTVAAKMAFKESDARDLLENEAGIYDAFPRHLMEHWCGLNLVMPITHPVPVGAVVPKFYGYYTPSLDDLDDKDVAICKRYRGLSPILLLEDCGTPIRPHRFSADERSECYSLLLRLHHANFLQQSLYTRNILWQPGPLTKPPSQRSKGTPSFRIIDFGRAEYWKYFVKREFRRKTRHKDVEIDEEYIMNNLALEWYGLKDYELGKAHDELMVEVWEY